MHTDPGGPERVRLRDQYIERDGCLNYRNLLSFLLKSLGKKREAISNRRAALLSELKSLSPESTRLSRQLFMREQIMQKCFRFGVAR